MNENDIKTEVISSVDAAARFGVTNDYITQLCRANKVRGSLIGRVWFVSETSLKEYLEGARVKQEQKNKEFSQQLRQEYVRSRSSQKSLFSKTVLHSPASAAVTVALLLVVMLPAGMNASALLSARNVFHTIQNAAHDASQQASVWDAWTSFLAEILYNMPQAPQVPPRVATNVTVVVPAPSTNTQPTKTVVVTQPSAAVAPVIKNTTVVQKVPDSFFASYVTQSSLSQQLTALNNSLLGQISQIRGGGGPPAIIQTFTGNTIPPNPPVLTALDIPHDIIASNYLPLLGGTLSGDLTINANLFVGTTTTPTLSVLSALGLIGIGTTSPTALLGLQGSIGVNASHLYLAADGRIGIGTTSPDATLSLLQIANGTPIISAYRATDIAPSGDFIDYKSSAGTTLFRVDNSGNLQAGGIINTGSQTITSISTPQFRVQYDASNEITESVSATGATTIGINGSAPSLRFSPQSNSLNSFSFTNAGAANTILSVDTQNQRVGVGTTSPAQTLSVQGNGLFSGTIFGSSITATGTLSVSGNTTLANATSTTFFSSVASSTGLFSTAANFGILTSGNTTHTGTLSVTSSTTVGGLLNATNDALFNTLTANGAATFTVSIGVSGLSTLTGGILTNASSTFGNFTAINATTSAATTTNFAISSISSGNLLKTTAGGAMVAAVAGTDFATPAQITAAFPFTPSTTFGTNVNATTTPLWFAAGFFASSTSVIGSTTFAQSGNVGLGTSSPFAKLSLSANLGDTNRTLFAISSSTPLSGSVDLFKITNGGSLVVGGTASSTVGQLSVMAGTSTPQLVGFVGTSLNLPDTVFVQGRYAYVGNLNSSAGLVIFDVSNPTAPVKVGSIATAGGVINIYVQGRYAYMISPASSNLLMIYDVSNPAAPTLVSSISSGTSNPNQIYVQGRYAYVVSPNSAALTIFDVGNPAAPVSVGSVTGLTNVQTLYVQGRFAYLAGNSNNFYVIDISNPAAPLFLGSTTGPSNPQGMYVQGRYAYVANFTGSTMSIFDVSIPTAPTQVGSISSGLSNPISVSVQGRYAYVTNSGNNTVVTFDVSDPVRPMQVNSFTSGLSSPQQIFVQGRYAYVASKNNNVLGVYDIGGAYIQQLESGGLETGTLSVRDNIQGVDASLTGSLNVAQSLIVNGSSIISATTTRSQNIPLFTINNATGTAPILTAYYNGAVGVGTTSVSAPLFAKFAIHANSNDKIFPTLFAIGSSTLTATSTLFSVSSSGSTTLFQIPSSLLKTDANGTIVAAVAGTDYLTSTTAPFAFTPTTNFNQNVNATNTPIWFQAGIFASSTSVIGSTTFAITGNVGIGTSNPQTNLDIQGATGLTLRTDGNSTGFTIRDRSTVPGHQVDFVSNASVTAGGAVLNVFAALSTVSNKNLSQISLWTVNPQTQTSSVQATVRASAGTSGEEMNFITQQFGDGTLTAGDITFNPNTTERLRITRGGNIGIGTTTPSQILSVQGNGLFSGNILGANLTATGTLTVTGTASTTNLIVSSAGGTAGCATFSVTGLISNTGISCGGAAPFSWVSNFGQLMAATTSALWAQSGLYASSTSVIASTTFAVNGNVGIGTSSPFAILSLFASASSTNQTLFNISSSTNIGGSLTISSLFTITNTGKLGIGTSSPYAVLSVVGASGVVADKYFATSTTATSTFAGGLNVGSGSLNYDFSSGVTSIGNLQLGALSFDTDSGQITWADMPVTSNASQGTIESYTAQLGGLPVLTAYSESNGTGGVQNLRVGVASSSPWASLSVNAASTSLGTTVFAVGSTSSNGVNTTLVTIKNTGNVGIGTTSPFALLSVAGNGFFNGTLSASSITGTSTLSITGLSTLIGGLLSNASSTIGSGTQAGGLTISGGATTTGNAYVAGTMGIGTTSPWRTLSVTGTVGFDGLTGAVGAGSLCLSADKEVVYNSGSDNCLSSLRSTKHDITDLTLSGTSTVAALKTVSFIYNGDVSSTVRFGFIAEDTAAVDAHLATYNASGHISGVDDRGLLSIIVKALQELIGQVQGLVATVAEFANSFTTRQLCVADEGGAKTCITKSQLDALLSDSVAGSSGDNSNQGGSTSGESNPPQDTASSTPEVPPTPEPIASSTPEVVTPPADTTPPTVDNSTPPVDTPPPPPPTPDTSSVLDQTAASLPPI